MNISIEKFSKKINEVINKISNKENVKIKDVAKILSKKYLDGSHLYIFGTGHNHCIAEESLHRAGAFAGATPMLDKKIDFLDIDVEGADIDVLESLDFNLYSPELICVEVIEKNNEEKVLKPCPKTPIPIFRLYWVR